MQLLLYQHRRLSYSRHAVNDRDLGTQVNYKTHMNIRRLVGDRKHHHKRSKRGKQASTHERNIYAFLKRLAVMVIAKMFIEEIRHGLALDLSITVNKINVDNASIFVNKLSHFMNILIFFFDKYHYFKNSY